MSEKESRWIKKALSGDNRAFNKLVKKYRDQMYYLAYNLSGNEEDAKDIAQEAFIKAYQNLWQFNQAAKFSTWLHKITSNQAIDLIRKRSRLPQYAVEENLRTPSEIPIDLGPDDKMQNALNQLSFQQRQVVVLKYYHDLSYEEIADIMHCTQSTVRNHMLRAMKRLRILLSQERSGES